MGRLGSAGARIVATVMNVLPWRARIDENINLKDFLADSERSLRAIRRHSRYRGEQLRRDLGLLDGMRRLHGPIITIQIGRATRRERVGQYGSVSGVGGKLKKKQK